MPRTIDVEELPSALATAASHRNEMMVLRQGGSEVGLFVPLGFSSDRGRSGADTDQIDAAVVAEIRRRRALSDLRAVRREVAADSPGVTEGRAMADALSAIEEVRTERSVSRG